MHRSRINLPEEFAANPVVVAAHRESMLEDIDRSIRLAEIRCLPFDVLLTRIERLWEDDAAQEIVYRACSEAFEHNQLCALAESARRLAEAAGQLASGKKTSVDRAVKRILSRMPGPIAAPIVEPWLSHARKFRRQIAYRVLRASGFPEALGAKLLEHFERTADQECLHLLARNPHALLATDAVRVLDSVKDEYWRMRMVQAVMITDTSRSRILAADYPHEFVWAAGRQKDKSLLPDMRRLKAGHSSDLSFVSLYAWALGQLGAADDLAALRLSMAKGE
ncbi:hypothetical protein NKI59_19540 [Mesorhizobium sp. M0598]|uniref:hypothetical protein n=1 Tax=Mesorhizobium sp. M0598 TaxID=2956968 RepID=UPI00333BDB4F